MIRSLVFGFVAALAASGVLAADEVPGRRTPDFELSDGRRFVRLSALPPKSTLINFWRADCPPCRREMPELARLAQNGNVRVIAVAVQKPAETEAMTARERALLQPPVMLLHAPSEPRGLLSRFGDSVGALPHTVWIDAGGRVCAVRTGAIDAEWIARHMMRCVEA